MDTDCSLVCGDARNDKHQEECDDDLHDQRLAIGSDWYCPEVGFWRNMENSRERGTGKYRTQQLSRNIQRTLPFHYKEEEQVSNIKRRV